MPIAKMQKLYILSHRALRNEVLSFLQKNELIEIKNLQEKMLPFTFEKAALPEIDYELTLAELNFAINFLTKIKGEKKGFIESFAPAKPLAKEEDVKSCFAEFAFKDIINKCKSIDSELANLKNLEEKLNSLYEKLRPWQEVRVKLSDLVDKDKICITLGKCPKKTFEEHSCKILRFSPDVHIEAVYESKTEVYSIILYLEKERETIEDLLKKSDFEKISLPQSERTPKEEMEYILILKKEIDENRNKNIIEALKLEKYKVKLMYAHDCLLSKKAAKEARDISGETKHTFFLEGWIRKRDFNLLTNGLREISKEIETYKVTPLPEEIPPVDIENPRFLRPLETVTKIYGLPKYKEIDPTPVLSGFFILFFGLCLGDAGYGITLSLVSALILRKIKLSFGAKNLLRLLFYGGIVSALVGALTGGWFGIDLNTLPPVLNWLATPLTMIRLIDPVKNPLVMLVLALALGVIQVSVGIATKMFMSLRDGNYVDAILDEGLWLYFIAGLLSCGLMMAGVIPQHNFIPYLPLSGAIFLVLTQGRTQKNIFMKLGFGLLSLYKTVGLLSDVLSYSRILALGLATTVLAMVINLVGMMTKDSIPILGYVIMLAIFVFGHLFNIVINTLGAFIHSGRLQYVEFFSKFLEGGGKAFKPFRRETKYVSIE